MDIENFTDEWTQKIFESMSEKLLDKCFEGITDARWILDDPDPDIIIVQFLLPIDPIDGKFHWVAISVKKTEVINWKKKDIFAYLELYLGELQCYRAWLDEHPVGA